MDQRGLSPVSRRTIEATTPPAGHDVTAAGARDHGDWQRRSQSHRLWDGCRDCVAGGQGERCIAGLCCGLEAVASAAALSVVAPLPRTAPERPSRWADLASGRLAPCSALPQWRPGNCLPLATTTPHRPVLAPGRAGPRWRPFRAKQDSRPAAILRCAAVAIPTPSPRCDRPPAAMRHRAPRAC